MKSFQADYIFPVSSSPIKNGIVTVDDFGKIISVSGPDTAMRGGDVAVEKLNGIICPGFINSHCHLELSHLRDKIERHTGLVSFIKNVQKFRNTDKSEAFDAAAKADTEMYENGIVAVGDISNSDLSIPIKTASKLYYHTFVEMFGFVPSQAQTVFDRAVALANEFKPQSCSLSPHAPYSVSKELLKLIKNHCERGENLITIHNQECDDENKFYRYKLGSFLDLYEYFGIDIGFFKAQARNSIQSVVPLLTNRQKILLVHNTCTNLKDIYFLKRFDRKINWCFCPNANLYIENTIPKVELFVGQGFNITLGTDSLASNSSLSILDEMRCMHAHIPNLDIELLVEWATLNGAEYLGIDDEKGTLDAGKAPGLNLLTGLDGLNLTPETKVKRLI